MENNSNKRTLVGKVVSTAMDKTISVQILHRIRHPLYGKYITKTSKVKAHDADNICKKGDIVTIEEHPPISKMKKWNLVKVQE